MPRVLMLERQAVGERLGRAGTGRVYRVQRYVDHEALQTRLRGTSQRTVSDTERARLGQRIGRDVHGGPTPGGASQGMATSQLAF